MHHADAVDTDVNKTYMAYMASALMDIHCSSKNQTDESAEKQRYIWSLGVKEREKINLIKIKPVGKDDLFWVKGGSKSQ